MTDEEWLKWYQALDEVQRKAWDKFITTGHLWLLRFFWHRLPECEDTPLPLDVEWLWWMWHGSLPSIQRLAVNAYFRVGDIRLILFVWDSLLDEQEQLTEVPAA